MGILDEVARPALAEEVKVPAKAISSISVRKVVRMQLGLEADPWELALVQRDLVWQEDRMITLLDSLLEGYPIGSLLICRVPGMETDARAIGTAQGEERRVAEMTPQLVDGQQRAYALFSIFTGSGHGRFYLNLLAERTHDASYIQWRPNPDVSHDVEGFAADESHATPDLGRFVDLSEWAETAYLIARDLAAGELRRAIHILNDRFEFPEAPEQQAVLEDRLKRLVNLWFEERIPVVSATVDGPEKILELFQRVNRGGAQVSGNDLYFAAVKTFWHDPMVPTESAVSAKAALDAVVRSTAGLLDTWGALSLISRLALAGIGEGDLVPLKVERLSKSNKSFVIRAIQSVSNVVAARLTPFTFELRRHSSLRQGLRFVHRHLWEEVFAWAVLCDRDVVDWAETDFKPVESYLLGASLFSYPQVLGDPYRRDALAVALDAGMNGDDFPLERLLAVARSRSEDLRRARRAVPQSVDYDSIAKANVQLVVAAAQGMPDDVVGLDWDHVIPASWRERLRLPRGAGRQFREEAKYIAYPGNFWQIDLSANRDLKADPPGRKFDRLVGWAGTPKGRVTPESFSGMTLTQIEGFRLVGDAFEAKDKSQAAQVLKELIGDRTRWLTQRLLESTDFLEIHRFGADHYVDAIGAPPFAPALAERLGLHTIRDEMEAAHSAERARHAAAWNDEAVLLGLGGVWNDTGQAKKLLWVLVQVTLRHAKRTGKGKSERVQKSVDTRAMWRDIYLLPLSSNDRLRLLLTGRQTADGHSPFRVQVHGPSAASIAAQIKEHPSFAADATGSPVEVSISIKPEMGWDESLKVIDEAVTKLRQLIEADRELL